MPNGEDVVIVEPHIIYNQSLSGYFGEFGSGANAQIFFLQSVINPSDLDKITLIGDIEGAETWSVRDLFQRDVDAERVTNGLLPYFKDSGKVKFFNPITLTLLPIDSVTSVIASDIPDVIISSEQIGTQTWDIYEVPGLYRFRHVENIPHAGLMEWNDKKVKIIAIDGQHRLSALKRFKNDVHSTDAQTDFLQWNIPAVVFSLRKINPEEESGSLLDIIRNIFIYINTEAKAPSQTRQILLTDESVNSICTQEVLEYSHENDVLSDEHRDKSKIPLLFYDWRGEEKGGEAVVSHSSMKSIVEIKNWLEHYILGPNFSSLQKSSLGIQPVDPLHQAYSDKHLNIESIKELRKVFSDNVRPGIIYLLENFFPYEVYINQLRGMEDKFNNQSDVAAHAFHKLRFGSHRGGVNLDTQVMIVYGDIQDDILDFKHQIPNEIQLDIGMRGVMYAFGELRLFYSQLIGGSSTWLEYSKWFTSTLNMAYKDGWLNGRIGKEYKLLKHITYDHGDTTVNFRLDKAKDALGAILVILLGRYGIVKNNSDFSAFTPERMSEFWGELYEKHIGRIDSTLSRGYQREVKVLLAPEYPDKGVPLTKAVKEESNKRVEGHLKEMSRYLFKIK
jgi:hypothetical protein